MHHHLGPNLNLKDYAYLLIFSKPIYRLIINICMNEQMISFGMTWLSGLLTRVRIKRRISRKNKHHTLLSNLLPKCNVKRDIASPFRSMF